MSNTFTIITGKDKRVDVINNDFWNYSDYQIKFMTKVGERPGFEHFITHGHYMAVNEPARKPGPINILWYENEKLHTIRLGVKSLLIDEFVSEG